MTLCVHLLGQPRLLLHAQPVKFAAPPRALPLLAYLPLNRSQAVERQQAAFALWPDDTEAAAWANLRRHLHQLQRALPPAPPDRPWLLSDATTLGWNPRTDFWLDVVRQLMALRYEMGDRAGAIQEYHAFEHLLRQELGVAPMPETRALHEIVLRNARLPGEGDGLPVAGPASRTPGC
jgi:DNA-binding SARP family transcriptional activator